MNNKTNLQVQNVVNKSNLEDTEVSTSSSTAAACNSKIIAIEMTDPRSLSSVSVTASLPISGYRSINRHINFS